MKKRVTIQEGFKTVKVYDKVFDIHSIIGINPFYFNIHVFIENGVTDVISCFEWEININKQFKQMLKRFSIQ